MQRIQRIRPALMPSMAIAATISVLGLLALSLLVQPPYDAGADTLQRMLGWARAALFSAGALAFLVGLIASLRCGDSAGVAPTGPRQSAGARPLPAAFTLVALGRTPDDTRAIMDAPDAVEAIRILWQWSDEHPEEHVVIYDRDGEPVAFKRPLWSARAAGRGAA